jgi:maleate isomerase
VLERDLWRWESDRVSWHSGRVADRRYDPSDPASHAASVGALSDAVGDAIVAISAVRPRLIVVGLSAAPFKGGVAEHACWKRDLAALAGMPVVTLGDGIEQAVAPFRSVSLLTPLHPAANEPIARYLEELGLTVERDVGLACADTAAIAAVTPAELRTAVRDIDGPDVDAIVQVGTNLDFVSVAAELATELGKPVIAANAVIAIAALAQLGLEPARQAA